MRTAAPTMVDRGVVDMSRRVPLLVILGATGTGKSRLGIELARKFTGEVISADSMQVYKGLDIVTAKVTEEEQRMARHHLINIVDPHTTNYSVGEFRNAALPIISDLMGQKKLPLVVGGTNYYIESLLWEYLITAPNGKDDEDGEDVVDEVESRMAKRARLDQDGKLSSEELHARLAEVDPEMAMRLHPNNRRKILRSLEVYEQHGMTHTELLRIQRQSCDSDYGGPLRYPDAVVLWLRCESKVLDKRLERRVDGMLEAGLLKELLDFHRRYNEQRISSNLTADYTKGIFQTIGFKEFHNYLILPETERSGPEAEKLLRQCVDDMKLATKRYARRQNKWVMNRIINANRQIPPVYALDCTDVKEWNSRVYEPAVAIVSALLQGRVPEQKSLTDGVERRKSINCERYYCEVCERVFIGDVQWYAHLHGRKHKKIMRLKKDKVVERMDEEREENRAKHKQSDSS